MQSIRRVEPFSVAKVAFIFYAVLGLVVGAIFTVLGLLGAAGAILGGADSGAGAASAFIGLLFGVGAVIFIPLIYGVIGAVMMALMAFLYNIVAGITGGVVVHLE